MHPSSQAAALIAVLSLTACPLLAAPSELTVDPAQSSISMEITLEIGTQVTDTDTSALSGFLEIDLDDPGAPATITLHDLGIEIDDALSFNWSFGFLGGADASMNDTDGSGAGSLLLDPGTKPIQAPVVGGAFTIPQAPTRLEGLVSANYNILFVGSDSVVVDLSTLEPALSDMPGTVSVLGDQITLTTSLVFAGEQPLVDDTGTQLGTIIFSGSGTVVATGTYNDCSADITGDGALDVFDVFAFLDLFNAGDAGADFTGDGSLDVFDVFAFLDAFNTGCP